MDCLFTFGDFARINNEHQHLIHAVPFNRTSMHNGASLFNTMAYLLYWDRAEKCLELIAGHLLGPGPDPKLTDLLLVALL